MIRAVRTRGPSDIEKAAIITRCQDFIDAVLKPRFLPEIRPTSFNYPVDIRGRWYGTRYRFIQRYRSGFNDNLGDEFDAPFTRLDCTDLDRFDIYWHRHNGTRFRLHRGVPLDDALKTIEADEILHPL